MRTLGDALPEEQARCRELLAAYKEAGPAGTFAAQQLEQALRRADEAAISRDLVRMIKSYEELKGCQ